MADTEQEEPGLLDKALNYLRGKASASDQFKKLKPNPSPQVDPDKAKSFEDSFKGAK